MQHDAPLLLKTTKKTKPDLVLILSRGGIMSEPAVSGNKAWVKGMKSPNPKGRPKGIVDRRAKITESMLTDASDIVEAVVAKAKQGDVQAAQLIISRVLPTLAAQSEKVEFELDTAASLAEQTEQVLAATSKGVLSPDSAQRIIQIIGALGEIRHLEDIEDRLAALEGNANA